MTAIPQLTHWLSDSGPAHLLIETSGSTGRPKRVVLSRSAVMASVAASARRLGARSQWLLAVPSSYVAGVQVICRSVTAGHEPVVLEGPDFAAAVAAAVAARPGVTLSTSLVPTQLHRLLAQPAQVEALRALHTILVGGGPVDPALRASASAHGLRVVATYGASETAGGCVYDGRALGGVTVDIGTDGRIRLGGPTLFDGYDGDPEATAEALVGGCFVTSDVGRFDEDGRLHVLGRIDDVVISGGVNVALPAVAARLREHPDVEAAEVLGVDDEEWGARVVAFVVTAAPTDEADLRDWVAEAHPRSWAPRQVVVVPDLSLLANGKVDREALRRLV